MSGKTVFGLIVSGIVAFASGCGSSNTSRAEGEPDYAAYSQLHAGMTGSGDKLGTSIAAHDSASYPKAANPRPAAPKTSDVAELPDD